MTEQHETLKNRSGHNRLYLVGAIVLLLGWGCAGWIYLAADESGDNVGEVEISGKNVYPGMHERSKKYTHDLEMYGGKAAVLADDFNRWFDELWHGQTLAFTLAILSAAVSMVSFYAGYHSSSGQGNDADEEKSRDDP